MEPNFSSGDYLIVDELSYNFNDPQRGEVIVFESPNDAGQLYIKRIIALPGETVEIKNGKVFVSNEGKRLLLDENDYFYSFVYTSGNLKLTLSEGEYFVLGDNRSASFDSRKWGTIEEEGIIGKVFMRAWPFVSAGKIEIPSY